MLYNINKRCHLNIQTKCHLISVAFKYISFMMATAIAFQDLKYIMSTGGDSIIHTYTIAIVDGILIQLVQYYQLSMTCWDTALGQ